MSALNPSVGHRAIRFRDAQSQMRLRAVLSPLHLCLERSRSGKLLSEKADLLGFRYRRAAMDWNQMPSKYSFQGQSITNNLPEMTPAFTHSGMSDGVGIRGC